MADYKFPKHPFRSNYLAATYCEIAMESWYELDMLFQKIKENGYSYDALEDKHKAEKKSVQAVVFSAMCLESFLNNFAAAAMGDDEFYENFDRLSPIGKLQLVSRFILKVEIDKSQSMYCRFKTLFRLRDHYVHNKSKRMPFPGMTLEDIENMRAAQNDSDLEENVVTWIEEDLKEANRDATNALHAVKELAEWFDEHEPNVYAVVSLFFPTEILYGDEPEYSRKRKVLSALGVKAEKYL